QLLGGRVHERVGEGGRLGARGQQALQVAHHVVVRVEEVEHRHVDRAEERPAAGEAGLEHRRGAGQEIERAARTASGRGASAAQVAGQHHRIERRDFAAAQLEDVAFGPQRHAADLHAGDRLAQCIADPVPSVHGASMNERFFIKTIAFYNIRRPCLHPKYRKSAINVAKTPRWDA
ncbi:conserved hypothetical protein, partial [Ricinus communis]